MVGETNVIVKIILKPHRFAMLVGRFSNGVATLALLAGVLWWDGCCRYCGRAGESEFLGELCAGCWSITNSIVWVCRVSRKRPLSSSQKSFVNSRQAKSEPKKRAVTNRLYGLYHDRTYHRRYCSLLIGFWVVPLVHALSCMAGGRPTRVFDPI